MAHASLTILFEDPFWIGLYEREEAGRYTAAKVIFGAEPKDCEVYEFLQRNWQTLRFSPSIPAAPSTHAVLNPKRRIRLIHKQTQAAGIGTKAQQALKLQQTQGKTARKKRSRAEKEAEAQRKFTQKQEKRKEKHRGH